MKYQAKIENNLVVNVIVAEDDFIINIDGFWISCEEYNLPSIGYTYTETEGFRPPKPYNSWIWNDIKRLWDSPVTVPDEENIYEWDESTQTWVMIYMKV
jgi:hypothetical protein